MRVVFAAHPIGDRPTGTAVYFREVAGALIDAHPEWQFALHGVTLRHRDLFERSATSVSDRLHTRITSLPQSVLRPLEHRLRIPPVYLSTGPLDIYHQMHLDADPATRKDRLVVTAHDTVAALWPQDEGGFSPYARAVLRRAAAVVTVSNFSSRAIVQEFGLDETRVHVIPNGVDHSRFCANVSEIAVAQMRHQTGLNGRYIVHIGGHTPRKNLERLIRAFTMAARETDYEGVLALAGPPIDVSTSQGALAASTPAVVQLGFVSDDVLPALLATADMLAYPSLYEGFGLPVLEAMAAGTRVVTSNATALPETAGPAAVFVEPEDTRSISAGIRTVLSEGVEQRRNRIRAGQDHARRFDWTITAARLGDVYEQVSRNAAH